MNTLVLNGWTFSLQKSQPRIKTIDTTVNDKEDKKCKEFYQQTSCIILAGGKSTRMQTNKALLKYMIYILLTFYYYIFTKFRI